MKVMQELNHQNKCESEYFRELLQMRIGRLSLLQQLRNRGRAAREGSAFKGTSVPKPSVLPGCLLRGLSHSVHF